MSFFLVLISFLCIIEGVVAILAPKKFMKFVLRFLKNDDSKIIGVVPLCIGILLLFSATSSALGWLIVLLGLAAIAKAVYLFLTPMQKIKASKWLNLSDNEYRALGILVLILGVLIFISRL
ncbi:MAG: hypothetical protein ABIC68_07765 [Candidatus Omnitrophota bacterium]